jgi:Zn-finger nucleic acid-binding protein
VTYREPAAPLHPCPRCRLGLLLRPLADVTLEECASCGGLFVSRELLGRLLDVEDLGLAVLDEFPRAPVAETVGPIYVGCPRCGKLMNRRLFAVGSEVIVDECRPHGTWFDASELPRLVDFAMGGGLKREAARLERLREKERAKSNQALATAQAYPTESSLWSAILGFLRGRVR